jgi:putative regulatory protein, FmdB family
MPSYDYRCTDCKEAFTVERSMNDTSKTMCTECGSEKVSRLWSVPMKTGGSSAQGGSQSSPSQGSSGGGGGCGPCSCC